MCSVSVFYFPPEDDEDGPTFKDRALECLFRGIDVFCVWECCYPWVKFKGWVAFIVFDPFIELFITLCIVVNTLFMALDHHDMDRDMERALKSGNYVNMRGDLEENDPGMNHKLTNVSFLLVPVFYCNFRHRSHF